MTALSPNRRRRLFTPTRISCLVIVVGLVMFALATLGISAGAADDTRDQITGVGTAESAVTVKWSDGLLGKNNQTMVGQRDPSASYAFMYDDFKNIELTVSQTENLVHQSVAVSWKGAKPTRSNNTGNFFQLMQCYGDADTGPLPENCMYGASGLLQGSGINAEVGARSGTRCPVAVDLLGCDPVETSASHIAPGTSGSNYFVPFIPVGSSTPAYNVPGGAQTTDYFDKFTTNEVQQSTTSTDGTGLQYFQTLTGTQASSLGCGVADATTDVARGCWIVIVPRGEYKPNNYLINGITGPGAFLTDSPLGASNWAQRIQVHLGFAPILKACPIGSAKERQTVGTEMAASAVYSWQRALNDRSNCSRLFGYTRTPESTGTTQLAQGTTGGAAGLAFTTIPIGSEAGRESGELTSSPVPVTYAPVAVAALTLSFHINLATGYLTQPIKLTPRLVAKALTQSYRLDLPQYTPANPVNGPLPTWAQPSPDTILQDPEFNRLNPNVPTSTGSGSPLAPLLTQDHSRLNQQLWQWIHSDATARAWLNGAPDEQGMVINPAYGTLKLGDTTLDSFPRAEPACHDTGQGTPARPSERCTINLLPYMDNLEESAVHIRTANNPEGASWDPSKTGPDGSPGWWVNGEIQPTGRIALWGFTNTPASATFGLIPAQLCKSDGTGCVEPNDASVTAALASAAADSTGLLHVDPAASPAGAYPLVNVTYAAVRTDDDPAAVADYAELIAYAAGDGQTPGEAPGELPRGYLPMPANLKAVAQAAVTSLRAGRAPTTPAAPTTSAANSTNSGSSNFGGGSSNLGGSNGQVSGGVDAETAGPATSISRGPASVSSPTSTPVVRATQKQAAPAARYAALGVILVGAGGLVGSPLARYFGRRCVGGAHR